MKFMKSLNVENDGHEEEQIQRRTDQWLLEASRVRQADQGVVPASQLLDRVNRLDLSYD